MQTSIALLRGINVGGHNLLPMQELRSVLAGLGLQDVRTHIQSGNAVFRREGDTADLGPRISAAIDEKFGFAPPVVVLTAAELEQALAACPLAGAEPGQLHFWFLAATPSAPDLARLEALRAADETFALRGRVFYLHAPAGIGHSRLAPLVEKALGVPGTARNGRTVAKLLELAG